MTSRKDFQHTLLQYGKEVVLKEVTVVVDVFSLSRAISDHCNGFNQYSGSNLQFLSAIEKLFRSIISSRIRPIFVLGLKTPIKLDKVKVEESAAKMIQLRCDAQQYEDADAVPFNSKKSCIGLLIYVIQKFNFPLLKTEENVPMAPACLAAYLDVPLLSRHYDACFVVHPFQLGPNYSILLYDTFDDLVQEVGDNSDMKVSRLDPGVISAAGFRPHLCPLLPFLLTLLNCELPDSMLLFAHPSPDFHSQAQQKLAAFVEFLQSKYPDFSPLVHYLVNFQQPRDRASFVQRLYEYYRLYRPASHLIGRCMAELLGLRSPLSESAFYESAFLSSTEVTFVELIKLVRGAVILPDLQKVGKVGRTPLHHRYFKHPADYFPLLFGEEQVLPVNLEDFGVLDSAHRSQVCLRRVLYSIVAKLLEDRGEFAVPSKVQDVLLERAEFKRVIVRIKKDIVLTRINPLTNLMSHMQLNTSTSTNDSPEWLVRLAFTASYWHHYSRVPKEGRARCMQPFFVPVVVATYLLEQGLVSCERLFKCFDEYATKLKNQTHKKRLDLQIMHAFTELLMTDSLVGQILRLLKDLNNIDMDESEFSLVGHPHGRLFYWMAASQDYVDGSEHIHRLCMATHPSSEKAIQQLAARCQSLCQAYLTPACDS